MGCKNGVGHDIGSEMAEMAMAEMGSDTIFMASKVNLHPPGIGR